jgi:hypothetical protein
MKAEYDGRGKGSPRTQTLVTHRTASRRPTAGPNGASATTFGPAASAVVSTQRHVQIDGYRVVRSDNESHRTARADLFGHADRAALATSGGSSREE